MPTSEPQAVTRDVLRRFVAAPADRRRRRRLPTVVVGAPEVPLPLPGPRPTVLRPTPNTRSVEELTVTDSVPEDSSSQAGGL